MIWSSGLKVSRLKDPRNSRWDIGGLIIPLSLACFKKLWMYSFNGLVSPSKQASVWFSSLYFVLAVIELAAGARLKQCETGNICPNWSFHIFMYPWSCARWLDQKPFLPLFKSKMAFTTLPSNLRRITLSMQPAKPYSSEQIGNSAAIVSTYLSLVKMM